LNVDPVDQVNISNYSINGLNPIWFSDPDGDLFGIKGLGSSSEQRQAAKKYAKETNGKVKSLLSNSIHVDYDDGKGSNNTIENNQVIIRPSISSQYFHDNGDKVSPNGDLKSYDPSAAQQWAESKSITGKLSYDIADGFYVTGQNLFTKNFRSDDMSFHIGGAPTNPEENIDALFTIETTVMPSVGAEAKGLLYIEKMNAAQFSKFFKGTKIARLPAKTRGLANRVANKVITQWNKKVPSSSLIKSAPKRCLKKSRKQEKMGINNKINFS
jgi:hypothetical protein